MSFITLMDANGLLTWLDADAVESVTQGEHDHVQIRTASGEDIWTLEDFDTVVQLVGENRSWELVEVVPADDPIGNHGDLVVRRVRR